MNEPRSNLHLSPPFLGMFSIHPTGMTHELPAIPAVVSPPHFSLFPLPAMRLLYKILMFSGISTVFYHTMHVILKSFMLSFSLFPPSFFRCIKPLRIPFLTLFFHRVIDVLSVLHISFPFSPRAQTKSLSRPPCYLMKTPFKVFSREDVFTYFIVSFPLVPLPPFLLLSSTT